MGQTPSLVWAQCPIAQITARVRGQRQTAMFLSTADSSGCEFGCSGHSGQVADRPASQRSSTSNSCSWSASSATRSAGEPANRTEMPMPRRPSKPLTQAHTASAPRSSCASSRISSTIAPLAAMSRSTGAAASWSTPPIVLGKRPGMLVQRPDPLHAIDHLVAKPLPQSREMGGLLRATDQVEEASVGRRLRTGAVTMTWLIRRHGVIHMGIV
jgi:hypothetical protein